uniref:Uncharacterized protein n=1 Tax=Romanomermis culicivorax TaxID=13658 RepID=A0A915IIA5_ROMCU
MVKLLLEPGSNYVLFLINEILIRGDSIMRKSLFDSELNALQGAALYFPCCILSSEPVALLGFLGSWQLSKQRQEPVARLNFKFQLYNLFVAFRSCRDDIIATSTRRFHDFRVRWYLHNNSRIATLISFFNLVKLYINFEE